MDGRVFFRVFTSYIVFDDDWVRVYKYKSLPESSNVMNMARYFNHRPKINRMLITRLIFIQWKFSTPDQFIASPSTFSLKYSLFPKLSTLSSDPTEFVDRPVPEKLDNSASIFPKLSSQNRTWCCYTQQFLSSVSTIPASNAWDPDSSFGAHTSET